MRRRFFTLLACLTLAVSTARAADQNAEVTLQRTLDQPFNLTLDKIELSESFKRIAETAKIALQVDPACYEALPYGSTTRVSADFRQSRLRDSIEEVLVPLGLQQTISGSTVIIRPSAPLAHIGRKAEWEELNLLKDLRTSPDLKPDANGTLNFENALRTALDRPSLVVTFVGESGPGGTGPLHDKAMQQIAQQLPMSAFRALDMYAQLTNQIWFVEAGTLTGGSSGGNILIMPMKRWIERQLQRPIQLSFTNAPLEQVVAELSHLSGIRFVPEPGLYQTVPVVTLNSNNGSVLQTLEALAGATRIAFDLRDDSMLLHMAGSQPIPPLQSQKTDNIVGRVAVPVGPDGPQIDVFIRESDLTPELNDLRKKQVQSAVEAMEKAWNQTPPAPAPSTAPATKPAH